MAGLPGGLGFDVYPPGQKLTIYLQRVGFASGTPVAVLTLAKLPTGVTTTTVPAGRRMHNTRMGEGARRQEATFKSGSATFTYAGREYSLPLDAAGRHSVTPGLYSYENGVRTALLEYGAGDDQYLLLRVPVAEGNEAASLVPYLVLNGRIVPPIDVDACALARPATWIVVTRHASCSRSCVSAPNDHASRISLPSEKPPLSFIPRFSEKSSGVYSFDGSPFGQSSSRPMH
jgi:hypothetical protein